MISLGAWNKHMVEKECSIISPIDVITFPYEGKEYYDKGRNFDEYPNKKEFNMPSKNQKDKVYISAKKGINMDKLLKLIEEALMEDTYEVSLLLPYDRGDIFSKIKDKYNVNNFNYEENGISVDVNLDEEDYNIYKDYIIK